MGFKRLLLAATVASNLSVATPAKAVESISDIVSGSTKSLLQTEEKCEEHLKEMLCIFSFLRGHEVKVDEALLEEKFIQYKELLTNKPSAAGFRVGDAAKKILHYLYKQQLKNGFETENVDALLASLIELGFDIGITIGEGVPVRNPGEEKHKPVVVTLSSNVIIPKTGGKSQDVDISGKAFNMYTHLLELVLTELAGSDQQFITDLAHVNQEHFDTQRESRKKIAGLLSKVRSLESRVSDLEQERDTIGNQLTNNKTMSDEKISELEAQLDETQSELNKNLTLLKETQEELSNTTGLLHNTEKELEEARKKFEQQIEELTKAHQQKMQQKEDAFEAQEETLMAQYEEKLEKLGAEISKLRELLQQSSEAQKIAKTIFQNARSTLQKENTQLVEEQQKTFTEIASLKDTIAGLNAEIATLQGEQSVLKDRLKENDRDKAQLDTDIRERDTKISQLETERDELQDEISVLKNTIASYKQEIEENNLTIEELQKQNNDLLGTINTLQQSLQNLQAKEKAYSVTIDDLKKDVATFQKRSKNLEGELESMRENAIAQGGAIEIWKAELHKEMTQEAEKQIAHGIEYGVKAMIDEEVNAFKQEIAKLEQQLSDAQSELEEKEKTLRIMEGAKEEMATQIASLSAQLKELQSAYEALFRSNERKTEEYKQKVLELDAAREEIGLQRELLKVIQDESL